jgi:hypothetical protein
MATSKTTSKDLKIEKGADDNGLSIDEYLKKIDDRILVLEKANEIIREELKNLRKI